MIKRKLKEMKKWEKYIRTKMEIKKGYSLCPICKKDTLETLTDDKYSYQERCNEGCYVYDFEKGKRIK